MQSLLILGRQPALGRAELESLLGADHIAPLGSQYALSDLAPESIPFERLGGSIKLCHVLDTAPMNDWRAIEKSLLQHAPQAASKLSEGKLHLGLSVYGFSVGIKDVQATALRLKKVVRAKTDQSVRVVPNNQLALTTAQILHNKLVSNTGLELIVLSEGGTVFLCQTTAEQDIEAYARRDQNRPKRDARVGMLPPKLAQIIVNLAAAKTDPSLGAVVLDPFCGTGVILQEALLMGFSVDGSDIEQRMIDYSSANLDWLWQVFPNTQSLARGLQLGDATSHIWQTSEFITRGQKVVDAKRVPMKIDIVACEGYLGQPFSAFPSEDKLREVMQTCNQIMKGFLKNIAAQLDSGTRLCIALPAWHRPNGRFEHLKLLDQIEELGYNRIDLMHTRAEELLYYRPDQVVTRELLIITRK